MKSQKSQDYQLARKLHEEINGSGLTENAILEKKDNKENYKPKTLVDRTLELIDPNPNIYTLFVQFNERFFSNVLLPVEVKWSNRMTSCAGTCTFHPRNRQCVISLSGPLLKLRPRKDLVETLLHEMIHGYLFLTNNNRDRDGHGPEFCKHMHRINREAGTSITIYHSFHNEVKLYQQHWWRCNGPCQKRAPYFGTVRRAMNRPPGPSDYWWKQHQQNCDGQFIKIKEPENFKTKSTKSNVKTKNTESTKKISDWFSSNIQMTSTPKFSVPTAVTKSKDNNFVNTQNNGSLMSSNTKENNVKSLTGIKKLGNVTNNVHGWGTGGPNGSAGNLSSPKPLINHKPRFFSSGSLGGTNTGKSNLLDKFDIAKKRSDISKICNTKSNCVNQSSTQVNEDLVNCPICNISISMKDVNIHLDRCLNKNEVAKTNLSEPNSTLLNQTIDHMDMKPSTTFQHINASKRKNVTDSSCVPHKQTRKNTLFDFVNCPSCNKSIPSEDINNHFDECFINMNMKRNNQTDDNFDVKPKGDSIVILNSSDSDLDNSMSNEGCSSYTVSSNTEGKRKTHNCLICNVLITPEMSLNEHLEECIGTVFNDDSISFENEDEKDIDKTVTDVEITKYPCPVCMELIYEEYMNEHLDECIHEKQRSN